MSKPTVFFSHSSKDKELVLSIKNKLDQGTGNSMNIFMSSDGQSIPFGTNWIHKVELGLQEATIMFVFVTKNSLSSGWIYFEAGYAYSKNIKVIPVGIGVDIASLRAPLNLLQGFNILSEDSLNNFITVINREFEYSFEGFFTRDDYVNVVKYSSDEENNNFRLEDVICKADFEIREKVIVDGNILQHDIKMFFENIVKYLEDNGIQFSKDDKYGEDETCVIACGVLIVLHKGKDDSEPASLRVRKDSSLRFHVSTYNFHQSFAFFISLLRLINLNDKQYIRLHLNDKYDYIDSSENRSSIISEQKGFDLDTTRVDTYVSSDLDLSFRIFDFGRLRHPFLQDNVVSVVYSIERVKADQIVNLVSKLIDIGLIFVR